MAHDIIMPQMGESLAEGTITKWLKKVGDTVERDEPLFEISTDKVDAEIPSPTNGTLLEIKHGEGATVEVNTVVGLIGAAGESAGSSVSEAPAPAAEPAPAASGPAPAPATAAAPAPAPTAPQAAPAPPSNGGTATLEKPFNRYSAEELRKVRSSPVVRRIAAEKGIDIGQVAGTGISGRVTKKDILGYIESGAAPSHAAPPAPMAVPAGATHAPLYLPDLAIPAFAEGEPVAVEPMSVMRQKIAEHMVYSNSVAAHVTSFFEVDFEEVAKQRKSLKPAYAEKGIKLTFLPFIVRGVVDGLQNFPYLNASIMGDQIVFKKDINVGIAVALGDGKGLIVPVLKHADDLNLTGVARGIHDLAERARTKKLLPEDVQRGTFSITNPGGYGGLMGTPIINQPQVAIMGIGAIEKRVCVVNDAIAIRHKAYISMSYDHRLVDGAMAELFMAHVKRFIEAGNIQ